MKRKQESRYNSRLPITDPERLRQLEALQKYIFGEDENRAPKTKGKPSPA